MTAYKEECTCSVYSIVKDQFYSEEKTLSTYKGKIKGVLNAFFNYFVFSI